MSHNVGHVVSIAPSRTGPDSGAPPVGGAWERVFTPQPAHTGGGPRFVMLHLTNLNLPGSNKVVVNVGYGVDEFSAADGNDVWTRPIDPKVGPITIRYEGSGATGGVTLAEYGSGEPTFTDYPAGQEWLESTTNADVFLHTNPYAEPTYQTWLRCGGTFDWQNVACVSDAVQRDTARAVGMIVSVHGGPGDRHVSTCSGTLIDSNLFLTARHCLTDPNDLEIRSGSVTFDFQTACNGSRPPGYAPTFYKIKRAVAAGAPPTASTTTATDWLLLELEQTPPASIVPRPLRAAAPVVGEPVFTVHHANATVKKTQARTLSSNSVTSVTGFDYGGGASGSALFDAQGRVIGAALSSGGAGPDQCTVGYCPVSSVIDFLTNPPAPPTAFDVMLVIDRSGSMTNLGTSGPGRTKMDEAKEAASLFVQLVESNTGHRMGMVSFSTTASNPVDEGPGSLNQGKKQQLVGPAPFTGGKVGALVAAGATSIGDGLQKAAQALGGNSGNQRAIVLMTDGMQNTPPMVATVEPQLAGTKVAIIGFGSDAQLDGALLTRLAQDHQGMYTRANDGLALKKFYALCFGNIFEAGMLADPESTLDSSTAEAKAMNFEVYDEETITAVVAWDLPQAPLEGVLMAPDGSVVDVTSPTVTVERGATWWFLRVPLPHGGQREGTWALVARRVQQGGGELGAAVDQWPTVRYQASVLADGGPRLVPLPPDRPLYTGDAVTPQVFLQYSRGAAPYGEVVVHVDRPDASLGQLVQQAGLDQPDVGAEVVPAFAATLQRLERNHGGVLPVPRSSTSLELHDDGFHDDGSMERDGVFGQPTDDLLRHEGTYTFHALAQYGEGRRGRREAMWSLTVLPGIDGGRTDVDLQETGNGLGVLLVRPHDRYGNPLGPGRSDLFEVDPLPGTQVTGPITDNGDGSYTAPVTWDPETGPGIWIAQPGRAPVPLTPGGSGAGPTPAGLPHGCLLWLLIALGISALVLAVALLIVVLS